MLYDVGYMLKIFNLCGGGSPLGSCMCVFSFVYLSISMRNVKCYILIEGMYLTLFLFYVQFDEVLVRSYRGREAD